jgi:hypothetical protein
MTTVVNIKRNKCDVYIGRGSPFGNPFRIGDDGDREQVLAKYRTYFKRRLTDPKFRDNIFSLKDKVLGCWCKPLLCHGDVIVEFLETNENQANSTTDNPSILLHTGSAPNHPSTERFV